MKVAVLQMRSVINDAPANTARAQELLREAAAEGADLAVLPEFFNTEYFPQERRPEYFEYAEPLDGPTIEAIRSTARELKMWVIASIYERKSAGLYYDTSVVIDREGQLSGVYRKTHPAGVFSLEKLYFSYGSHFPVHMIEDWKVGISICYDNLFPESARILTLKGAEMIVCPFASHPGNPVWIQLHTVRAFENGAFVLVANKVGKEGEWSFAGRSMIIHPSGENLSVGSMEEDDLLIADLDRSQVDEWRRRFPMLRDRRPDLYGALVTAQEDL